MVEEKKSEVTEVKKIKLLTPKEAETEYSYLVHQIGEILSNIIYSEEYLSEADFVDKAKEVIEKATKIPEDNGQIVEIAREFVTAIKTSSAYAELIELISDLERFKKLTVDVDRTESLINNFDINFGYLKDIESKLNMGVVPVSYSEETLGKGSK